MIEAQIRNLIISFEEHFEDYTEQMKELISKNIDKKTKIKISKLKEETEDELYFMSENTIETILILLESASNHGLHKIRNKIENNLKEFLH